MMLQSKEYGQTLLELANNLKEQDKLEDALQYYEK